MEFLNEVKLNVTQVATISDYLGRLGNGRREILSLYGSVGTGKSHLARLISDEYGVAVIDDVAPGLLPDFQPFGTGDLPKPPGLIFSALGCTPTILVAVLQHHRKLIVTSQIMVTFNYVTAYVAIRERLF